MAANRHHFDIEGGLSKLNVCGLGFSFLPLGSLLLTWLRTLTGVESGTHLAFFPWRGKIAWRRTNLSSQPRGQGKLLSPATPRSPYKHSSTLTWRGLLCLLCISLLSGVWCYFAIWFKNQMKTIPQCLTSVMHWQEAQRWWCNRGFVCIFSPR